MHQASQDIFCYVFFSIQHALSYFIISLEQNKSDYSVFLLSERSIFDIRNTKLNPHLKRHDYC